MTPTGRTTSTYSWLPLLTSIDSDVSLLDMLRPASGMQEIHSSEETVIYRAELNRAASPAVVLKVATNAKAVERLRNEHTVYCKLQAMQGTQIPRCHGLFLRSGRAISKRWAGACLLLDYCGEPLAELLPDMPWKFRKLAVQSVEKLHKDGGVEHYSIIEHILVHKVGNEELPYIISFGRADSEHKCKIEMNVAEKVWRTGDNAGGAAVSCQELIGFAVCSANLWMPCYLRIGLTRQKVNTWDVMHVPRNLSDEELAQHPLVKSEIWVEGFKRAWEEVDRLWSFSERLPNLKPFDETKIVPGRGGFRAFIDANDE